MVLKNTLTKFIALFIFLSVNGFSQLEEDWPGYKVSIPFIKVLEAKPILVPSKYQTKVYPPQTSYDIVGYSYKLQLTISISGDSEKFNKAIPIIFKTPANEEIIFTFNQERNSLQSNRLYDVIYEHQINKKGYTEVGLLRKFSDSSTPISVYENCLSLE